MKTRRISACLLLCLSASLAWAHPMGNFSVNRYARLEPSKEEIGLLYIVDFAEIPTFQEISKFPALAADLDPASLNASPDRTRLADRIVSAWLPGLTLASGGRPIRMETKRSLLGFAPGVGGLPTMKLRLELEGAWPNPAAIGALHYEDSNAPDRLGWREVLVRPGSGVRLSRDFSSVDRSHELTDYPIDPSADIPKVVSASFEVTLSSDGYASRGPLATPSRRGRETRGVLMASPSAVPDSGSAISGRSDNAPVSSKG